MEAPSPNSFFGTLFLSVGLIKRVYEAKVQCKNKRRRTWNVGIKDETEKRRKKTIPHTLHLMVENHRIRKVIRSSWKLTVSNNCKEQNIIQLVMSSAYCMEISEERISW